VYKVAILMSTYNGDKYLEQQIESIINQKNVCISIYIRDDGSSDNTVSILKAYNERNLIQYYSGSNMKPAKSFIELLCRVSNDYDYYAFSDQDDVWVDEKIIKSIQLIEKHKNNVPALAVSNLQPVNKDLVPLGGKLLPDKIVLDFRQLLIYSPHLFGCTMLFNQNLKQIVSSYGEPNKIIMRALWVAVIAAAIGTIEMYSNS